MAKQQLEILNGQDRVLAILDNFASKDMPGTRSAQQSRTAWTRSSRRSIPSPRRLSGS